MIRFPKYRRPWRNLAIVRIEHMDWQELRRLAEDVPVREFDALVVDYE